MIKIMDPVEGGEELGSAFLTDGFMVHGHEDIEGRVMFTFCWF